MNIFLLTYILTMINGFFCKYIKDGKRVFCITSGIAYFLIAALRRWDVGGDSYNYKYMFELVSSMDLRQVIQYAKTDPFFFIFLKALSCISENYTFLFSVVAAFFVIMVWTLIYRYSDDPVLSIIILLAFNLYQFSLTGMRQTIAMGFIVLSLIEMKEQKRFSPYLCVILGSLFHSSAFIFIIIPLLRRITITTTMLRYSSLLLVVVFILRRTIASIFIIFIQERGYNLSLSNSGATMMFVIAVLYVMAIVFLKEYSKTDKDYFILYYMGWFAVFFEILVTSQNIFFRAAFYFLISYVILIPNLVSRVKSRNSRLILKSSMYILMSAQYLLFTIGSCYILPYTTFWQT